jgi:hypothetical protein
LYIIIFKFFDSNREDRRCWTEWYIWGQGNKKGWITHAVV